MTNAPTRAPTSRPSYGLSAALGSNPWDGSGINWPASLTPATTYTGGNSSRLGQGVGWYNLHKPRALAYRNMLLSGVGHTELFVGDSTTEGIHAAANSVRTNSWVSKLAAYHIAQGRPAATDSFMGDANQGSTTAYLVYNTKTTGFSSGWAVGATDTLGGKVFQNSTTGNSITFAPSSTCTAIDIITIGTSGYVLSILFDGVVQGTITPTTGANKTTVIAPAGTTILIRRTSGTCFVTGAVCRDPGGTARIDMINAGRGSSGSVIWSDNTSSSRPINVMPALNAPVTWIDLLIGDWGDSAVLLTSETKANKKVIIDAALAYGSIPLLVVPHPTPTTIAAAQKQRDWIDIDYQLSDEYGLALFDLHAHFLNDWQTGISDAGYAFDVSSHINAAGYTECAAHIGAGITKLLS